MPFKNEKKRKELQDKVMKLRKRTGWGRVKIARELGVSENTVGNWLYSKSKGRKYHRDWERKHRVTTTGHRKLLGEKRHYPTDGVCELCPSKGESLDYHHWDDNNLMKGFWLCRSCHTSVEWFEHGDDSQRRWVQRLEKGKFVKRYVKLKAEINEEVEPKEQNRMRK